MVCFLESARYYLKRQNVLAGLGVHCNVRERQSTQELLALRIFVRAFGRTQIQHLSGVARLKSLGVPADNRPV